MFLIFLVYLTPFSADKVAIIKQGNTRLIHLIKNVVIENDRVEIRCNEAVMNEAEAWVRLKGDVKIIEVNARISARNALYYFKKKTGYLNKDVMLEKGDKTITADSLFYDGQQEIVEMFSNVIINDKKNNLKAYGAYGYYNLRDDTGYLNENPHLEVLRENAPPIFVSARAFHIVADSSLFYGYDSVFANIDSITISCDTFSYFLKREIGAMINPVVTEKDNFLKGVRGRFKLFHKKLDYFEVEDGRSRYYNEAGSKNIVEGESITIRFKNGKASIIEVKGSPHGVLTLKKKSEDAGD